MRRPDHPLPRRLLPAALAASLGALVAALLAVTTGPAVVAGPDRPAGSPTTAVRAAHVEPVAAGLSRWLGNRTTAPPTTAQCVAAQRVRCYSPVQYARAYSWSSLHHRGVTGRGRTIAVVELFGSPTVAADLAAFDRAFGLPDPPSVSTLTPVGAVPAFDPRDGEMAGWAAETTLDVEYAHAAAPGARILVVAAPPGDAADLGFGPLVAAEQYVVSRGLADVVSQSFGAPEADLGASSTLRALRTVFSAASRRHVSVLAASGDTGVAGERIDGTPFASRVVSWPASDPLVTAVGGTQLSLDAAGARVARDRVWNDGHGAGGGGVSTVFARPSYQSAVRTVVGPRRGLPDVSMSAAVDGAALVWSSFDPSHPGWSLVGGTSEACPLLAGVVAMADQSAGRRLGALNPRLYALAKGTRTGLVDVTAGDNGFGGVIGYRALRGFDLASGWGTVTASTIVRRLAAR